MNRTGMTWVDTAGRVIRQGAGGVVICPAGTRTPILVVEEVSDDETVNLFLAVAEGAELVPCQNPDVASHEVLAHVSDYPRQGSDPRHGGPYHTTDRRRRVGSDRSADTTVRPAYRGVCTRSHRIHSPGGVADRPRGTSMLDLITPSPQFGRRRRVAGPREPRRQVAGGRR